MDREPATQYDYIKLRTFLRDIVSRYGDCVVFQLLKSAGTIRRSYGCLQGKTKLQIKLVDCSTSDLYWSAIGLDVSAFDLMDVLRVELSK